MNLNIRWIKSKVKSNKKDLLGYLKRTHENAYIRMYTGGGKTKLKRLDKIYRYPKVRNLEAQQREHNKLMELKVAKYLTDRQTDDIQGVLEIKSFDRKLSSFVEYGRQYIKSLIQIKESSKSSYKQAVDSFEDFFGVEKTIHSITEDDVIAFKMHMKNNGKSRYGRPYAIDTINTYLNRCMLINAKALNSSEVFCTHNYFADVPKLKHEKESKGEYISTKDYAKLDYNKCLSKGIAKAFMFSVLCGLRKTDVEDLIWKDIEKDEDGWFMYKSMSKGRRLIRISLSPMMLELFGERQGEYAKVFNFHYSNNNRGFLYSWLHSTFPDKEIGQQKDRSGLKGLTFHSARASFITNLLLAGISPFAVMKYVGHRDLKTTMRYYRGKDELQEKDMLVMDEMYRKEIVGVKAKQLIS